MEQNENNLAGLVMRTLCPQNVAFPLHNLHLLPSSALHLGVSRQALLRAVTPPHAACRL